MISWQGFFSRPENALGLLIVALFVTVALAASWLAPVEDPAQPNPYKRVGDNFEWFPLPPSAENPLGTAPMRLDIGTRFLGITPEQAGRRQLDVYHTLIWGTRWALRFGLTVTLVAASFGVLVGLVSGYMGSIFNGLAMRVTDAFLVFPPIAAVWLFSQTMPRLTFEGVAEPVNFWQTLVLRWQLHPILLALIVFSWMPYARIVNALVLQLKNSDYITAARSLGAGHSRILFRHLLPNVVSPAIVLAARDVGAVIILESAFTFIGIGGYLPWSVLLAGGRDYVIGVGGNPLAYWWVFLPVSLALILFGVGWNLLGDGLNVALNPRARRQRSAARRQRSGEARAQTPHRPRKPHYAAETSE